MGQYPLHERDTRKPSATPPPNSCDSQVHVFGSRDKYPVQRGAPYDPPDATFDDLRRMHRTLGIERAVIVQSAVYGTDHRVLLEALAAAGAGYRGCAIVDDTVSDADLMSLHDAGVRGARFNFVKILKTSLSPESVQRSIARIQELGWYAKIFVSSTELFEYMWLFRLLKLPVVIDHMGHLDYGLGLKQPALQLIIELLKQDNWWVLISNGDRDSLSGYPWDDSIPFARALIAVAPDRVIWGTDWPHAIYEGKMPNDADLLELLYRYVSDTGLRRKILVDNPAKLFGFDR